MRETLERGVRRENKNKNDKKSDKQEVKEPDKLKGIVFTHPLPCENV